MSALSDENPPYRLVYRQGGDRVEATVRRSEMRDRVEGLRRLIASGGITGMRVTNRFNVDVTVDWFG